MDMRACWATRAENGVGCSRSSSPVRPEFLITLCLMNFKSRRLARTSFLLHFCSGAKIQNKPGLNNFSVFFNYGDIQFFLFVLKPKQYMS